MYSLYVMIQLITCSAHYKIRYSAFFCSLESVGFLFFFGLFVFLTFLLNQKMCHFDSDAKFNLQNELVTL